MKAFLELRTAVLDDKERDAKVAAYQLGTTDADPLDIALWVDRYGMHPVHIPCAEAANMYQAQRLDMNIHDPIGVEGSYWGQAHLFSSEDAECELCGDQLVLYPEEG